MASRTLCKNTRPLRRMFSQAIPRQSKKSLYISLIRSILIYCSQLWKPHLLKDILALENVQRRSTKFILNDFTSRYKSHLTTLRLLPFMMLHELNDIFVLCYMYESQTKSLLSDNILHSAQAPPDRARA